MVGLGSILQHDQIYQFSLLPSLLLSYLKIIFQFLPAGKKILFLYHLLLQGCPHGDSHLFLVPIVFGASNSLYYYPLKCHCHLFCISHTHLSFPLMRKHFAFLTYCFVTSFTFTESFCQFYCSFFSFPKYLSYWCLDQGGFKYSF